MINILETKVTKIKDRWHAQLLYNDNIIDEMACNTKEDIGFICRELLRWHDKLGGNSIQASKSRERNKLKSQVPKGKIWYYMSLKKEREQHV